MNGWKMNFPFWDGKSSGGELLVSGNERLFWMKITQLSKERNPGWLGYIVDYTTQSYSDSKNLYNGK